MSENNTYAEDMLLLICSGYSPQGRALTLSQMVEILLRHHDKLSPTIPLNRLNFNQYVTVLYDDFLLHWFGRHSRLADMSKGLIRAAFTAGSNADPEAFLRELSLVVQENISPDIVQSIKPNPVLVERYVYSNVVSLR